MKWPSFIYKLNDEHDHLLGDDKQVHLFGAAFAWMLGGWVFLAVCAIAVEVIEVIRWAAWQRRGGTGDWPFLTDKVSLLDLAADVLGGVLALLASFVFNLVGLLT